MQSQHQPKAVYRPQDKRKLNPTKRVTFNLSQKTVDSLDEIRSLFRQRWPLADYPTLSAVLEKVLEEHIAEFERSPAALEEALTEFREKYPTGTQPYNVENKEQVNK